jgi:hypothetical protein
MEVSELMLMSIMENGNVTPAPLIDYLISYAIPASLLSVGI